MTSCLIFLADQGKDFGDQTVARVLVGDCNLSLGDAEAATQDSKKPCSGTPFQRTPAMSHWHVGTTNAKASGDMLFVMRVDVEPALAPVGQSYEDRGMRHDQHDVVAAQMQLPVRRAQQKNLRASQPEVTTLPVSVQQLASQFTAAAAAVLQPGVSQTRCLSI